MEAIGMLVMPEFFTYRSLQRMTGGCKDVAISQRQCIAWGSVMAGMLSRAARYA